MTVRMSPMVAASFAETRARRRLGMAIAAIIPMIATLIKSSIKVKPVSFLVIVLLFSKRWSSQDGRGVPLWAEETQRSPDYGRFAGGFRLFPMSRRSFHLQGCLFRGSGQRLSLSYRMTLFYYCSLSNCVPDITTIPVFDT